MSARKGILSAFCTAIETAGSTLFTTVAAGYTWRLGRDMLPAAVVSLASEDVNDSNTAQGWAIRDLVVEVRVLTKHGEDLADQMEDYAEAVEQAVLYETDLGDTVMDIRPLGYVAPEFDLEQESPLAQATVRFGVTYSHWPADPSVSPIPDPTVKPDPDPEDPELPG